jgi:hypothetical protein
MATTRITNDLSRRSYLSVAPFHANIFKYSSTLNAAFQWVGGISALPNTTAANCPRGRVLRENGKRIYPDANPGVTIYMVGVYDAVTGFTGFIDPNSPVFTLFNTDKPNYIGNSTDPGPGGLRDLGMPIYTNTSVDAGTYVSAGANVIAGANMVAAGYIQAGDYIRANTYVSADTTLSAGTLIYSGTGLRSLAGQNRVAAVPNYPTSTQSDTIYLNVSASQVSKITIGGSVTAISVGATNNGAVGGTDLSALGGSVCYVIIINNSSAPVTVTLGNQIRETGSTSGIVVANGTTGTITFVCDGISLFEICRTTAVTSG